VYTSRIALALLICWVLALPLAAQTTTGTIAGAVLDPQGATVPDAKVTARNIAQNTVTSTTTDRNGEFLFTQMLPATYTITIEKQGFRKVEQTNVVLTANGNVSTRTITLQVGAASESVEVVAKGDLLQTETAQRSVNIVGTQVANIQNNGRNFLGMLRLVPGMYSNLDTQQSSNQTGDINMNGSRGASANVSINGASNVDTGSNTKLFVTVNPDTIQEFAVLTNSYDAEYGKAGGAQINVVTKSGTIAFHGMGYEYFRDSGLNSNSWDNKRKLSWIANPTPQQLSQYGRQAYHYNSAGYNLGGPVYIPGKFNKNKNKLFFFWSDEYQRQLIPTQQNNVRVPTAAERLGDFSQSIDPRNLTVPANNPYKYPGAFIKDPNLTGGCSWNADPTKVQTAGCFQDGGVLGKVPTARLYGAGQKLLQWLPVPNTSAANGSYNFTSQSPVTNPRHEQLLRVDYNINDKWRLNGTWANLAQDIVTSDYCPAGYSMCSNFPVGTPWIYNHPGHIFTTNLATAINNKTINEFIFDIGTHPVQVLPQDPSKITVAGTGINLDVLSKVQVPNGGYWIPNFTFNGGPISNSPTLGNGGGSWTPYDGYNTTIEVADNFSRMQGTHYLKFGFFVQRSRKNQPAYTWPSGNYNFGYSSTNPLDTGNGFANALLGVFQSYGQASAYVQGQYRYTNAEFYVRDSWRLTRRLTLNLGVRAYYNQPQYDQGTNTANFLPSLYDPSQAQAIYKPSKDGSGNKIFINSVTGATVTCALQYDTCKGKVIPGAGSSLNGLVQAGQKGMNAYLMKVPPIFFAPRFGLAFDVTGKGNVVFRMGGGAFPDRYQGNQIFTLITNPPASAASTVYNAYAQNLSSSGAYATPYNLNGIDTNDKIPVIYNWNAGIQATLPKGFSTDIAYVGGTSRHLVDAYNLNGIPFGGAFLPQNQDPTKSSSLPGGASYDSVYIRPYQGIDNINMQNFGGTSNYNALQAQLNRRFSSGLFLAASYVWSKCMDVVDGDGGGLPVFPDPTMQRAYAYGPCGFDVRQNFTASYVYPLPKFSKMLGWNNGVASRVLDGWLISGVTTFRNGNPTTVNQSVSNTSVTNYTGTGSQISTLRAVLVGNPLAGTSNDPYNRLNAAAYVQQSSPTYGFGQGKNQIITPGVNNFDLAIQKSFTIKEGKELLIKAEAFNAFNHVQFAGLNNTISFNGFGNNTQQDGNKVNNPSTGAIQTTGFGEVVNARTAGLASTGGPNRVVQLMAKFVF
jgi:hypothetical protein